MSWQLLHWLPFDRALSGEALLLSLNAFAMVAVGCAWRRTRSSAQLRRAWLWVGLAMLGQAAGAVAQIYYEAAGVSAYPSLAEPLYLSFYPLLLVGVLSFPATRRSGREALELVLDGAIVTLGGERLAQAQRIAQVGAWEWDLERGVIDHSDADMSGLNVARRG